jgi:hypothetical protein
MAGLVFHSGFFSAESNKLREQERDMNGQSNSIIALDQFIQSTRDSGYKSTASAVSELVDNSIQAHSSVVSIQLYVEPENPSDFKVCVSDDGCGMGAGELTQAMRFGGSSRFNNRDGLGRFGMGLPNASLSQARTVSVYSWQGDSDILSVYLDVDEIANGRMKVVPDPVRKQLPDWVDILESHSGTVVVWDQCDRLEHKRLKTNLKRLHESLGTIFRYFIWEGVKILLNGESVQAIDPLLVHNDFKYNGARLYNDPWTLEVRANPKDPNSPIGIVEIKFSEFPVHLWHELSNEEKRVRKITKNAGVSIVRGNRQIDYAWFFMGSKRKENYDDWWRCEIKFDPVLDDAFGLTHTKQQIRPREYLIEAIQPYTESMARELNGRVKKAHSDLKLASVVANASTIAESRDKRLRPLPKKISNEATEKNDEDFERIIQRYPLLENETKSKNNSTRYRLIEDDYGDSCFFKPYEKDGIVVGVINSRHSFYKSIYKPLADGTVKDLTKVSEALQLMIMAAARAEAVFTPEEVNVVQRFRNEWSQVMTALLSGK